MRYRVQVSLRNAPAIVRDVGAETPREACELAYEACGAPLSDVSHVSAVDLETGASSWCLPVDLVKPAGWGRPARLPWSVRLRKAFGL